MTTPTPPPPGFVPGLPNVGVDPGGQEWAPLVAIFVPLGFVGLWCMLWIGRFLFLAWWRRKHGTSN